MGKIEKAFSWRAFISFGLLFSFILIFLTGVILYISPAGRIAHWVNWKLFGFSKEDWQAIHTVFSYVFVIFSILHLFFINWKVFWSYLKNKTISGINRRKEFYFAFSLSVLIFLGVIFSVPPFSSVMDLGEYFTESWENRENEPPIPHAELLTLIELSEQLEGVSIERITNILTSENIQFNSTNETLEEIGILNSIPPIEIYNVITSTKLSGMAGSGMGNKSLEEFASENEKDINQLIQILKENGIEANKEQTLKDIASENNIAARDVYELIK